ncbi:THAP domain containing protein 10 [Dissostichus eleginoides]|uniref:THAP domain containing protein 10 n=1 Tax=Dissostichus eleginoides TaxID=100907 RepID=A0AAD9ENN3_DISEL|nr:THAP domain containing protein 10 [Dissostichus eleginoides]
MEFRMGYRSQDRVRLIASAVPSIHLASLSAPVAAAAGGGRSDGRGSVRDSAPRKRELCTTLGDNGNACHEGTDSPTASDAGLIDPEQEVVSPLVPQPTSVHHCGSQCNLRPLHRSSAVQVQPRMVSVGCQTESPLPSPPAHSDDESSSVSMDHPGDMPWSPEEEMMSESSDEEPSKEPLQQTNFDLNAADKFIVCQSHVLVHHLPCLLWGNPGLCGAARGNVYQDKTSLCNMLHGYPDNRMLKLFGLQCISASTFFRHQRLYTIPTIVQAWQNEQAGIIRELKEMGGGLILSGDCRSDSPAIDRINKVLDLQLVQSSEVPSSTWCELEGLKRSIDFLKEQHMQVSALITDRNRQVAKWVREELCPGGTSHFFDIWHIVKSLGKALDAAAKERECEDLKLWRPAIINHLYWTAASTPDGDPDVMEAKWQSMVNHVQDIHEHGTPAFPCCAHPPLEGQARDKEWLEPGTTYSVHCVAEH